MKNMIALLAVLCALCAPPAAAAARPLPTARALLQAGKQQAAHGPNSAHSTGTPIPTSTVGGSDVFVVDTTTRRVGANGGVLANTVQDNARSGSTYDIIQTQRHTEALGRANAELRTLIGGQDHAGWVQEAASGQGAVDAKKAADAGHASATLTARGDGKFVGAAENRAALASLDSSAAVQMVAGGGMSATYATRSAAGSAASAMVPKSYSYVYVPTWN